MVTNHLFLTLSPKSSIKTIDKFNQRVISMHILLQKGMRILRTLTAQHSGIKNLLTKYQSLIFTQDINVIKPRFINQFKLFYQCFPLCLKFFFTFDISYALMHIVENDLNPTLVIEFVYNIHMQYQRKIVGSLLPIVFAMTLS